MFDKERDVSFDILKGIGILLVCIGHTPTFLTSWIYGFHMPLFIFISGYFYKHSSWDKIIAKGVKNNIKPWLIFCLTSLVILLVYILVARRQISDLLDFITPLDTTNYLLFRTIWFLPCLFMIMVLYSVIKRLIPDLLCLLMCLLLYCLDCLLLYNNIHLPFFLDTAMGMVVFYALGYEIKHSGILNGPKINSNPSRFCLYGILILVIYTVLVIWLRPKTEWKYNIFDYYNLPISLLAIIGLLFICKYLGKENWKFVMLLSFLGVESLVIMGLHTHLYDFFIFPALIRLEIPSHFAVIPMLLIAVPLSIWINFRILHLTKRPKSTVLCESKLL